MKMPSTKYDGSYIKGNLGGMKVKEVDGKIVVTRKKKK